MLERSLSSQCDAIHTAAAFTLHQRHRRQQQQRQHLYQLSLAASNSLSSTQRWPKRCWVYARLYSTSLITTDCRHRACNWIVFIGLRCVASSSWPATDRPSQCAPCHLSHRTAVHHRHTDKTPVTSPFTTTPPPPIMTTFNSPGMIAPKNKE